MKALLQGLLMAVLIGGTGSGGASEQSPDPAPSEIVRGTTNKSFAEVIQELDFSITDHNFRITGRNTIGKSLRERGYQDFPDVEVIHFCSLENAREVLLLDPGYVAMMPCRVSVHEAGNQRVVSMILLPEQHPNPQVVAFAKRMNQSLREILEFVLEKDPQ